MNANREGGGGMRGVGEGVGGGGGGRGGRGETGTGKSGGDDLQRVSTAFWRKAIFASLSCDKMKTLNV